MNKLALIRYKTIDQCLRNRFRKWTLEDLIDAVSDALYEYEGMRSGISKRTIQLDIQNMRSDKLGYEAPIIVLEKKYYTYEHKDYSIMKSNIGAQDLDSLNDAIRVLKQFSGFAYFEDIGEVVGRLEAKLLKQRKNGRTLIDLEKNNLLVGLNWIEPLLKAIKNEDVLDISYQSFKAAKPSTATVHPYLLKEYRNRWFLLCRSHKNSQVNIMALDRIKDVSTNTNVLFISSQEVDIEHFFDDIIGVTKNVGQKSQTIVLQVNKEHEPYLLTKPMHHSQTVLKQDETGTIFSINVIPNFELEREILGYGEALKVLSPRLLQKRILRKLELAVRNYGVSEEIS